MFISELTEYRSNANSYSRCLGLLQSPVASRGGMQITDFEDLEIRKLRFAYEGREVLTGTNLLVRAGEKVAYWRERTGQVYTDQMYCADRKAGGWKDPDQWH